MPEFLAHILLSSSKKTVKLKLPFSIGRNLSNQIIVRTDEFPYDEVYVHEHNGHFLVLDIDGKDIPLSFFKRFGIKFLKLENVNFTPMQNLLLGERHFASQLPKGLRDFFLLNKTDKFRAKTYVGLLAFLVVLYCAFPFLMNNITPSLNRSLSPIYLELGQTAPDSYGNFGSWNHHPDMIIFQVDITNDLINRPGSFQYKIYGLDIDNEISVFINGHLIHTSEASIESMSKGVNESFALDKKYLKAGLNRIIVKHNNPGSDYLLAGARFRVLKDIDSLRLNRVQLYLVEATSLYNNRNLSLANIINARNLIGKIHDIQSQFVLDNEIAIKVSNLEADIDSSLEETIVDFWFNIDKKVALNELDAAITDLLEMKQFFPDRSTAQGQKIDDKIKEIESILGKNI